MKVDKELYKEIKKNFPKIEKFFTEATLLEFLHTPIDDLEKYNFGLGTMIRLKLLHSNNVLYKKFIGEGSTDRDEMVTIIIKEFHKYILLNI